MACNCSKNRTASPTGFGRAGRDAQTAQRQAATSQQSYEHTDPKGEKTILGSKLEASAAQRRTGGTIRPV